MRRVTLAWLAWFAVGVVVGGSCSSCAPGQAQVGKGTNEASSAAPGKASTTAGSATEEMKLRIAHRPPLQQGLDVPNRGAPAGDFALDPGDAEWTLSITPRAEIQIFHRGVQVVKGMNHYWAQGTTWAGPNLSIPSRTRELAMIDGTVTGLGLKLRGLAMPISSRELRVDLEIAASKPFSGITGGGISWMLKLDSPSFDGKPGEPSLLPGNTGWRWPVARGQEITVRFEEPIAKLFFEGRQKTEIRTNFVGSNVVPGRSRVTMTVSLPEGGRITEIDEEKYAKVDRTWFQQALPWDSSPVDLSFLNAGDRPAGRHGMVKVDGDRLVFEDGTPARFWGTNLSGPALFTTPRENIPRQAHRMAQLGYNLVRIVQHEANWVNPNIFGTSKSKDTRHLDRGALDLLDYWIKCLKDEGIYVWLDIHYLRELKPADGLVLGRDEVAREKNVFWGFNYVNPEIQNLMKEFQRQYLAHVNRYTRRAYKDDPAVMGVLITNENDLTFHFGLRFLPDKHNPVHQKLFEQKTKAFVRATGMPANLVWQTWLPGPSKYLLGDVEHQFNRMMIDELRAEGVKVPIATTNLWGANALFSLPPLTDGDVVDVHCYGVAEALSADPRYQQTFPSSAAAGQVYGKPLTITEWNVPYPALDRFTTPLYMASMASLQGWDAPMLYNYSQRGLVRPGSREWELRIDTWSTYNDPAISGVMPAAAIAFRRGHISPARKTYCLQLKPEQLLGTLIKPENSATIRTLVEQSKLTIVMPAIKELPWLKPSEPSGDVTIVAEPDHNFIPPGETSVKSDTGEIVRSWKEGVQLIDTPRTQAVSGWIGGKSINLKDATFQFKTAKAVVALSSIDDEPLATSKFILITAVGPARPSPAVDMGKLLPDRQPNHLPFLSEPVVGTITLRTKASGLELLSLGAGGKVVSRVAPSGEHDALAIRLPAGRGTHWYVLKARGAAKKPAEPSR